MNPQNQQKREIKFSSQKNGRLLVVNSEAAMSIASELESNSSVISYQPNWPLEDDVLSRISHVDIRASYFQKAWTTDFRLILTGGVPAIREIATLSLFETSYHQEEQREATKTQKKEELQSRIETTQRTKNIIDTAVRQKSNITHDLLEGNEHNKEE